MTSHQPAHASQSPRRFAAIAGAVGAVIVAAVGITVFAAERDPVPAPTEASATAPSSTTAPRPAYLIIQDEIDRALAARD